MFCKQWSGGVPQVFMFSATWPAAIPTPDA